MTETTTYRLWAVLGDRRARSLVDEYPTYDLALAAYTEVEKGEWDEPSYFAVRSSDDPLWALGGGWSTTLKREWERSDESKQVRWAAQRGVRQFKKNELNETVRWALKFDTAPFHSLVNMVTKSYADRGLWKLEQWEAQDALKSRVLLGRCRGGCERAYWMRKKSGRKLYDLSCPHCGRRLSQTTLALHKPFLSFDAAEREKVS